jgi:hypothetical protein
MILPLLMALTRSSLSKPKELLAMYTVLAGADKIF